LDGVAEVEEEGSEDEIEYMPPKVVGKRFHSQLIEIDSESDV